MLQGEEPAARSAGITRKGNRERRSGPRMGTRIASPVEWQPPGGAGLRCRAPDARPGPSTRGTPPHVTAKVTATGHSVQPTDIHRPTGTRPRGGRISTSTNVSATHHNCPTARPHRHDRPTSQTKTSWHYSQVAHAVPHRRDQALAAPAPSTVHGHSGRGCNFFRGQSAVAPGNVHTGCSTTQWCSSSPLGAAGVSSASRISGWSSARPGWSSGASIGAT